MMVVMMSMTVVMPLFVMVLMTMVIHLFIFV